MMKKGDSAVTVQMVDTLMKQRNQQLPPECKKRRQVDYSAFALLKFFQMIVWPGQTLMQKWKKTNPAR